MMVKNQIWIKWNSKGYFDGNVFLHTCIFPTGWYKNYLEAAFGSGICYIMRNLYSMQKHSLRESNTKLPSSTCRRSQTGSASTYIHTYIHTRKHTHIHTYTYTYIHTYAIYTHSRYTHTHTHTHRKLELYHSNSLLIILCEFNDVFICFFVQKKLPLRRPVVLVRIWNVM